MREPQCTLVHVFRSQERAVEVGMSDDDIAAMKAGAASLDGATLARALAPELATAVKADASRVLLPGRLGERRAYGYTVSTARNTPGTVVAMVAGRGSRARPCAVCVRALARALSRSLTPQSLCLHTPRLCHRVGSYRAPRPCPSLPGAG